MTNRKAQKKRKEKEDQAQQFLNDQATPVWLVRKDRKANENGMLRSVDL